MCVSLYIIGHCAVCYFLLLCTASWSGYTHLRCRVSRPRKGLFRHRPVHFHLYTGSRSSDNRWSVHNNRRRCRSCRGHLFQHVVWPCDAVGGEMTHTHTHAYTHTRTFQTFLSVNATSSSCNYGICHAQFLKLALEDWVRLAQNGITFHTGL